MVKQGIEYRANERCMYHWYAAPESNAEGYVHHALRVTYRTAQSNVPGCPSFRQADEFVVSHKDTGNYANCGNHAPIFDNQRDARAHIGLAAAKINADSEV